MKPVNRWSFSRHAIDRDVDLVDAGFAQDQRDGDRNVPGRVQYRRVRVLRIATVSARRLFRNGSPSVYAQHLDRFFEFAKVVDDFLKDVEPHDTLKSAGLGDPCRDDRSAELCV